MDILESRSNNKFALSSVEKWLDLIPGKLLFYYEELITDDNFLLLVSESIKENNSFKSEIPGLFKRVPINNVDWYGLQRILLYCLVRELKPEVVLETGVYYGGNSVFILNALAKNDKGKLISIDYPQNIMVNTNLECRHPWVGDTENYDKSYLPGFIVPESLKDRWELLIGDSLNLMPDLGVEIDLFVHDSEHTFKHVFGELDAVWDQLSSHGLAFVDDIDWSNGFYSFVLSHFLYPLMLTDNGKDDLRVRTGLIKKSHRFNDLTGITK
jgi:hypothetical protein